MKKRKKKYIGRERVDIRLLTLDMDGTTLTTDKVLTPRTREDLEKCIEKGIVVAPSTGRVCAGIPESVREIPGMRYVIASNGGSVVDIQENKVVYSNCIPWEKALSLFDQLESYHTFYDVYANGVGWCEGRFYDDLEPYGINPHIQKLIKVSRNRIDDLRKWVEEHKVPIEKINMFFADQEARMRASQEIAQRGGLTVTRSLDNNIEINSSSSNKGDAMANLAKILGIPLENCMACGDGNNDLESIRLAGVGVAMANGVRSLKRAADYVTKTNDEEGVAYAIEKFCLQNSQGRCYTFSGFLSRNLL